MRTPEASDHQRLKRVRVYVRAYERAVHKRLTVIAMHPELICTPARAPAVEVLRVVGTSVLA